MRNGRVERRTKETEITVELLLEGRGVHDISTGIGFFDHMLEQLSRHSLVDLVLRATGDLHIDMHHTVEDTGIALGQALSAALGDRIGIFRYGQCDLPMDEALTRCALDLSGRGYLVWKVAFSRPLIGELETELIREFFQALAMNSGMTLHIETLYGSNNHHIAETCFKALARALRMAVEIDPRRPAAIPSTKGTLTG
jgi:imidazoleglycerol-phosphate dehydratase